MSIQRLGICRRNPIELLLLLLLIGIIDLGLANGSSVSDVRRMNNDLWDMEFSMDELCRLAALFSRQRSLTRPRVGV